MHILILPSWYVSSYNSLMGVFFKEQAEALIKEGHKVGVIAIQGVGVRQVVEQKKLDFSNRYFVENGVHTYRKQYPDIKLDSFIKQMKMLLFVRMFEKYIKEQGLPDIVHLHSFLAGDFALYIKEKYNVPFVVTEHLSAFSRDRLSVNDIDKAKRVFEKSAYNISVSHQFVELLQDKFALEFNYIPNIVNIDFFQLKKVVKNDGYHFINIAFLDKNKNQSMLIQAFSNAFKNKSNVKLTIVGNGVEYKNLDKLIIDLKMENQISLYGKASREEVRRLLQNSDAFVLSSQVETFGVVVIEAMACGLPVIATKCGGPESIINSDKVGLLSELDENKFSEKMLEVYYNRENYDCHYIRKYVEENFSEKAVSLKLNDVYEKVLKK